VVSLDWPCVDERDADCIDVFGSLASCSNCQKTKKTCTFEWLRSQRVSQSKEPTTNSFHPSKRRRTSSKKSGRQRESFPQQDVDSNKRPIASSDVDVSYHSALFNVGVTFADFACGTPDTIEPYTSAMTFESISPFSANPDSKDSVMYLMGTSEEDEVGVDNDSGKGSSLDTMSDHLDNGVEALSPQVSPTRTDADLSIPTSGTISRTSRKRRRRSPLNIPDTAQSRPILSLGSNLVLSANNALLTEGLLKIYHNSFENALSCWVTERTCPYRIKADMKRIDEPRPEWNRIYHHVFRLDRLAANVRGRQLTFTEDQAAAKALNLTIYAFATQWAQDSERCNARYPFDGADSDENNAKHGSEKQPGPTFDRLLQINAWHQAHNALHAAGQIESFRVVLAQIVFALTQKPGADKQAKRQASVTELAKESVGADDGLDECSDLLSKLNLAMEDGPPIHLEQGLRLIHSLRSRVAMRNGRDRRALEIPPVRKQYRSSTGRLDEADRAIVDLLFWLGVMFDTLSSAMNNRPLVVSDEDSNIFPEHSDQRAFGDREVVPSENPDALWDGYLFAHQNGRLQTAPVRWPCSFDQAAALLCDAAPVKVLLFRKVTRIQTLITRNAHGPKVETALSAALDVHAHWAKLYAPFIQDCIKHHDQLHPQIQSWYTCLAGHWHLAALLLGDLIEIADGSDSGVEAARLRRTSTEFVALFRKQNCQVVSEMAARACPRDDASFSQSSDFHFALNQGSILTEPWTAVLIRVFAKAGVILLEFDTMLPSECVTEGEDNFRRADQCVRALWYLGKKSDMALSAAKILGNALKDRRKDAQEKMVDMQMILEDELWHGFENPDEAFDVECAP
jgi:hypothetical protein